ncbi:MAG: phage major capsid protein [Lachnospiraceae bacterium]|nr:phage major capsid protein [Lachnospiraceae bacterium]
MKHLFLYTNVSHFWVFLIGRAEEDAFINGSGEGMPTGILHSTDGAEVGFTTTGIIFDDMAKLYLSVKPEHRKNGVWIMNDETALTLRTLKDNGGGYLWNHNSDTIFGKPVHTSEFMPSAAPGSLPVAFGDFSHYWIVNRLPLSSTRRATLPMSSWTAGSPTRRPSRFYR